MRHCTILMKTLRSSHETLHNSLSHEHCAILIKHCAILKKKQCALLTRDCALLGRNTAQFLKSSKRFSVFINSSRKNRILLIWSVVTVVIHCEHNTVCQRERRSSLALIKLFLERIHYDKG